MLENFEESTSELTNEEKELLPFLINGFITHTIENPIKAPQIVMLMNNFLADKRMKAKFSQVRLRKFVNYIRTHSMLPLIATSLGYYVSSDKTEIASQIKSLRQRANSINNCADGLKKFL